jgi:hypothetical protein
MKRVAAGVGTIIALATVPAVSLAHHSTAMFEWGKAVSLKNVRVDRWEWTNPHTFLYVTATDADGKSVRWAFEGMSPNHLSRAGWSKRSLKPGDRIDLTYYPLRDGRNGGFNVTVAFQDGRKLEQLPSQ